MNAQRFGVRTIIILSVLLLTGALHACRGSVEDKDFEDTAQNKADSKSGAESDLVNAFNEETASDPVGDGEGDDHGDDSTFGRICSEELLSIDYQKAKLMIVLDMSGSMVTPESKYLAAQEAIVNMIDFFSQRFLFGFDSYPDVFVDDSCTVDGPIWFDCDENNEEDIISWLDTHMPVSGSGDPLLLELDRFLTEPDDAPNFTSTASEEDAYLLILADGDDCCGPDAVYDCAESWEDELAKKTRELSQTGIKTIVVGYTRNADPNTLDAVAANGDSPFESYIPALDQAALTSALKQIGGSIASCSFKISKPDSSADPNRVNFYFDDTPVPFDDGCARGTGWTWENDDHTAVQLCKTACDQLSDGNISNISAKFGCPIIIV